MQHPVAAGNRKIYRRQKMGFVLIHIAYFFPKATRCVILFLLHFNKFFKTLLTHSTCRGIFLVNPIDFVDWFKFIHKMWSCSFWTQPQKVVGYHRETHHFSEGKSAKEFTAPQHTRFILPLFHPTKSIAMLHGRYFSFTGNAPWKSHEPTERDTDFSSTPLHKQGQELRSEQTVTHIHEQHNLYLFLRLNNSETFVENAFWAQR